MYKKMKAMSKRILAVLLALVLILSVSATALAAWSSYQRNNQNNGVAVAAPTGTSPTFTAVQLATSGTVYSGIDVEPVINGNYAYVLYNGGTVSGQNGGARLAKVDLTSPATPVWNIQLSALADNNQQLSTPYLDTSDNTLYAGVTYYSNQLQSTGVSGWKDGNGNQLASFSFPAGTTTVYYDGLVLSGGYYEPQLATDIAVTGGLTISGTVTLTDVTDPTVTYSFTSSGWAGSDLTLYNSGNPLIPAGTYDLELSVTSSSAVSATSVQYLVSQWQLFKVPGVNSATAPTATAIAGGDGQFITHINSASNYLYFGVYEGDRCYYQCSKTGGLTAFQPSGGEDFYWAGAVKISNSYVAFGSESGKIYKRPTGTGFGSAAGSVIDLTATETTAGAIRSSLAYDGTDFYVSSRGGFLWKVAGDLSSATAVDIKDIGQPTTYVLNSVSTPVISNNGYVYVGGHYIDYNSYTYYGALKAVNKNNFNLSGLRTIYSGDAVYSSPAVFSTSGQPKYDYVYFTTNGPNGAGYCYRHRVDTGAITSRWNTAAAAGGTYTLQGVGISDSGYLAFGNDANYLYVVR